MPIRCCCAGGVGSNLVSNTFSHTPRGGRVSLEAVAAERDGMVHIVVRDTGEGIESQELPSVLDRFYRNSRQPLNAGESAGLCLAIVKSIMTLHRGSITIESSDADSVTPQHVSLPVAVYTHPSTIPALMRCCRGTVDYPIMTLSFQLADSRITGS